MYLNPRSEVREKEGYICWILGEGGAVHRIRQMKEDSGAATIEAEASPLTALPNNCSLPYFAWDFIPSFR